MIGSVQILLKGGIKFQALELMWTFKGKQNIVVEGSMVPSPDPVETPGEAEGGLDQPGESTGDMPEHCRKRFQVR